MNYSERELIEYKKQLSNKDCTSSEMTEILINHYSSDSIHLRNTGRRKSPDKASNGNKFYFNSFGKSGMKSASSKNWCYNDVPQVSATSNFIPCVDSIRRIREIRDHFSQASSFGTHLTQNNTYQFDYQSNFVGSKHRQSVSSESNQSCTWLYMVVWLASVLPFINSLSGDFVHDDLSAITSNPDVTGKNPLYQTFLNDYWGKPLSHPLSHKSYRPLTIFTFRSVFSEDLYLN